MVHCLGAAIQGAGDPSSTCAPAESSFSTTLLLVERAVEAGERQVPAKLACGGVDIQQQVGRGTPQTLADKPAGEKRQLLEE